MATIFEQHSCGLPDVYDYESVDGEISFGFYFLFLKVLKWQTDPKAFFKILEVDRIIGWTNPAHVEELVFKFKGIKIIEDEIVSRKIGFIIQPGPIIIPFAKNNYFFRIGPNGATFEIIA